MRTVYKTKYYTVKKDDSGPTPKYLIYRDGVEVKKCSSQVEGRYPPFWLWTGRSRRRTRTRAGTGNTYRRSAGA